MLRSTSTSVRRGVHRRRRRRLEVAEDAVEIDGVRAQLEMMILVPRRGAGFRAASSSAAPRRRPPTASSSLDRRPRPARARGSGSGGDLVEERVAAQVGAHERRLAAQPRGDQRVGIRLAEQHERAAEPLDVRVVPRLARDEILGDEARLGRGAGGDVGVGQLRLRAVHRRLRGRRRRRSRPAASAPECDWARASRIPAARRPRRASRPARPPRRRRARRRGSRRRAPARRRSSRAARSARGATDPARAAGARSRGRPRTASPRSCMSATVSSSVGIVAGGLDGQVLAPRSRGRRCATNARASSRARARCRRGWRAAAWRSVSSASSALPCRLERRGQHPELLDASSRTRARARSRRRRSRRRAASRGSRRRPGSAWRLRAARRSPRAARPLSASSPAISFRSRSAPALSPISMRALAAVSRPS